MRIIIPRLGNVYGDVKNRGLIALVFQSVYSKKEKKDIVLAGDGLQVRDFVFVDDVASALVKLLCVGKDDIGIVNVTTGIPSTLLSTVEKAQAVVNKKIAYSFGPAVQETFSVIGDNEKLFALTSWRPETSLEEGLRITNGRYIVHTQIS